jgi:lipid-binding SYLF domain-containing protein
MKGSFLMNKNLIRLFALTLALCLLGASSVFAKSLDEEREELAEKREWTLEKLYEEIPSAQYAIENSYGYAVLNNTGVKILVLGSAHGRGTAVNNETGEEVYLRMQEGQVGLGIGAKEYALIFVIETPEAWEGFVRSSGWKASGAATAAANDGVSGGSIEGAALAGEGIWVYQLTTKGLALELSIKGTRIYPDKKLNDLSKH